MLEILIQKITSLALVMAAGFLLVRWGPFTKEDTRSLSKLTCYLIMPCSLFHAFQMERSGEILRGLGLVMLAALLLHGLMILLTAVLRKPLGLTPTEEASAFCTNAGNLIIPLVSAMLGPQWVIYTCAYILVQTTLLWSHVKNLVCGERGIQWKNLLLNPNILALLAGAACFLLNLRLPSLLDGTIDTLGNLVGPIAMLVVGMTIGSLRFQEVFGNRRVWLASALRLLVFPLLCLGLLKVLCLIFPQGSPFFLVSMLAASAPSAAVITHICQLYGKDPTYVSAICTVTTTACILTIPLMMQLYLLFCM